MGPAGPEGPAGNAGMLLLPVTMDGPTSAGGLATLIGGAACPTGKRVIAGGPEVSYSGSGNLVVSSSYPESDNSWRVVLRNTSVNGVSNIIFRIHIVCVDF
jgi:hypothetical protein